MRTLLAVVLLLAASVAQQVHLSNYAPTTFTGWIRRNVSPKPPHSAGRVGDVRYVVGRQTGADTWSLDVWAALKPGQRLSVDLADSVEAPFTLAQLPSQPLLQFGGPVLLGGQPMAIIDLRANAAAYEVTLRRRDGMFATTLWVRWYPDQPALAYGEAVVACSNPALPAMGGTAPDTTLQFGDAIVVLPGKGGAVLAEGTFADGQARVTLPRFVWPRHLGPKDLETAIAALNLGVGAVAVRDLWASGNPVFPQAFDARSWAGSRFAEALRRMHTWDAPLLGPNIRSADTGAQEDQFFHPGGEALLFPGAEWPRLASALKLHGERPCNHLEPDGSQLDLSKHPGLLMWDGRPFEQITSDMLGKPRSLMISESRGRFGPDTQHWLTRSLGSVTRITGSRAGQWLLGNLARVYLRQRTTNPSWATSATFSAREWCYEGTFVVQCWRNLEDRALARQVVENWRTRVERFIEPLTTDYLQVFEDDPRLGADEWIIGWQESAAAWGIDEACRVVGPASGRAFALRVAKRVLRDGWTKENGAWVSRAQFPLAGDLPQADGSFNDFGMPMCAAVVLRHEPEHEKARAVIDALVAAGAYRWLPPNPR